MVVVKYKKMEEGMFFSHLNMIRLWNRILNIAGIEVEYSQGFNRVKKLAFSSPTRVGVESECEYIAFKTEMKTKEVETRLEHNTPKWLKIEKVSEIEGKFNVASLNTHAKYFIDFSEYRSLKAKVKNFFEQDSIVIDIILHGEHKKVDVKNRIFDYEISDKGIVVIAGVGAESVRIDQFVLKMLETIGKPNNSYEIVKKEVYHMDDGKLVSIDEMLEEKEED